jgi:NAD(P)H-flavin reductase
MSGENVYKPYWATIKEIRDEAGGGRPIKTFKVVFDDEEIRNNWTNKSGQCAMVSIPGVGEAFFGISSPPAWKGFLEFSIMRVGVVTSAIHELEVGEKVTVRGPYGNGFPLDLYKGHNLYFIGGGIGIAPLRSVYMEVLHEANRKDYGDVTIIYGARTPADLAFRPDFDELKKRDDVDVYECIDWKFGPEGMIDADAAEGWPRINMKEPAATKFDPAQKQYTAFVPQMVEVMKPKTDNAYAITCGPPIVIKFVTEALDRLGWTADRIYTTLENRMKCGIGKCGRCNVGEVYVCKDGPVFSYEKIKDMPPEY